MKFYCVVILIGVHKLILTCLCWTVLCIVCRSLDVRPEMSWSRVRGVVLLPLLDGERWDENTFFGVVKGFIVMCKLREQLRF